MQALGIIILILLFFYFVWPTISRWLKRKAMERAEDYLRQSMGMPPRDKKGTKSQSRDSYQQTKSSGRQRRNPFGSDKYTDQPIIPKEYAEDVEYIETKEFTSTTSTDQGKKIETYHESQISDVEWTEIKEPHSK